MNAEIVKAVEVFGNRPTGRPHREPYKNVTPSPTPTPEPIIAYGVPWYLVLLVGFVVIAGIVAIVLSLSRERRGRSE